MESIYTVSARNIKSKPPEMTTQIVFDNSVARIPRFFAYLSPFLNTVVMSEEIKIIGQRAFSECDNLNLVIFPESIVEIEDSAFSKSPVQGNLVFGNRDNKPVYIRSNAFGECGQITSVTFYSYANLGPYAFFKCFGLLVADLKFVLSIEQFSFKKCSELETIENLQFVREIGEGAFYKCIKLGSHLRFNSLRTLGRGAFIQCESLEKVSFGGRVTHISDRAFDGCENLQEVDLYGVTSIGEGSFYNTSIINIDLTRVRRIGDFAFTNPKFRNNLAQNVCFSNQVDHIGRLAFAGTNIKRVRIRHDSLPTPAVVEISREAFSNCRKLEVVEFIGVGDFVFGQDVFKECVMLHTLVLPSATRILPEMMCSFCTMLVSISIPNQCTMISYKAFHMCASLTTIMFEDRDPELSIVFGECCFLQCDRLRTLTVPCVSFLDRHSFASCWALRTVTFNRSASVDVTAFKWSNRLTDINFLENDINSIRSRQIVAVPLAENSLEKNDALNMFEFIAEKHPYIRTDFTNDAMFSEVRRFIFPDSSDPPIPIYTYQLNGMFDTPNTFVWESYGDDVDDSDSSGDESLNNDLPHDQVLIQHQNNDEFEGEFDDLFDDEFDGFKKFL